LGGMRERVEEGAVSCGERAVACKAPLTGREATAGSCPKINLVHVQHGFPVARKRRRPHRTAKKLGIGCCSTTTVVSLAGAAAPPWSGAGAVALSTCATQDATSNKPTHRGAPISLEGAIWGGDLAVP
jgi:hypothetical protein